MKTSLGSGKPEIQKRTCLNMVFFVFAIGFASVFLICTICPAQTRLGIHPRGQRLGDQPPEMLEKKPAVPLPVPILPPVPSLPEKKDKHLPLGRVFVSKINIIGSTIFSDDELSQITEPYVNRELSAEDLETLRRSLTLLYINSGYINSGAIIPDQAVIDGVITLKVVEGELTRIEVEGVKWFRPDYIKSRIALSAFPPLNVVPLQQKLQLLQQDPRIERLNAELRPGIKPGMSELNVRVEEKIPYQFSMQFNNYQSPSVGAERGEIILQHRNLTGRGDTFYFSYGLSEGVDGEIDTSYTVPITSRDTTLALTYEKNDFQVVEEPFEPLNIESESEIYGITLRHPFYRTLNHEFALAITGEHLHNETSLLGEPFSFSYGAEDGEITVTALRFSQEWTYRSQTQSIAARSQFSWGIDALGATIHDDSEIPDGEFFSWLGQIQWARRLDLWDTQMIFRTDFQMADEPLFAIEQLAVGGRYTVRGYRENQMVRDNGFVTSIEFRIPLATDKPWADFVQIAPFFDYGWAENEDVSTPDPKDIASIGLGLRWEVTLPPPHQVKSQFEIYWGYAFRDIEYFDWDLQDDGIHLQFTISSF